jgi:hypothetical protein
MIGYGWVSVELFTGHVGYPRKLTGYQFNSCRCLFWLKLGKLCQTLKLRGCDDDSNVRLFILHIPPQPSPTPIKPIGSFKILTNSESQSFDCSVHCPGCSLPLNYSGRSTGKLLPVEG